MKTYTQGSITTTIIIILSIAAVGVAGYFIGQQAGATKVRNAVMEQMNGLGDSMQQQADDWAEQNQNPSQTPTNNTPTSTNTGSQGPSITATGSVQTNLNTQNNISNSSSSGQTNPNSGISASTKCGFEVTTPGFGANVSSPILIEANMYASNSGLSTSCNGRSWSAFEGEAGIVELVDAQGNIYGSSILSINESDWMMRLMNNASVTMTTSLTVNQPRNLNNASGLRLRFNDIPANGAPSHTLSIPVAL